ncbi:MAG: thermonuclease family protein [Hyphomicrobiaceae bacterium]|nr:thermonuclease family protein [Hyphomicrobiaceae bacterium]
MLAVLALLAAAIAPFLERGKGTVEDVSGRASVIDGDSLTVAGREVRLHGIDAPEGRQTCRRDGRDWACGDAARDRLASLIRGRDVVCEGVEIDRHGRLLAVCRVTGIDIGREMVVSGLALAYGRYGSEEADAKSRRNGLWGAEFQKPRDWREERGIGG